MMKHRTIYFLIILLASIIHLQSSCVKNKSEPKPKELPPITTEGRNTIGFLLNGEVWLPGGGGIGSPDKEFVLDTFSDLFIINTYYDNRTSPHIRQGLILKLIWKENHCIQGELEVHSDYTPFVFRDNLLSDNCSVFKRINNYKMEIIFCDLESQIISGTFELTIENECGDVYEITDGRFDAQFRYF